MNMKLGFIAIASATALQLHAAPVQFEDTSDKLGFTRGTESWGIAWGDLNGDNWPDLWNSGHRDFPRLYRNDGKGGFDDITMWYDRNQNGYWLSNTQFDVHGGAWGDYDNDGDEDLLVGDEDELFINESTNGGFFRVSRLASMIQNAAWNNTDNDRELESDVSCNIRAPGNTRTGQYILLFDADVDGDTDEICVGEGIFPYAVDGVNSSLFPSLGLVNDTALGDFNNDLRTDMVMTRGSTRTNGAAKVNNNRIEAWFKNGGRGFTFSALGEIRVLIDGERGGVFRDADEFLLNTNGTSSASGRGINISYNSNTQRWTVEQAGTRQGYVRIIAQNSVSEPVMFGLTGADLPIASNHGVNTPSGFEWVSGTGLSQPKSCVSVVAADFDNDMDVDLYMACRNGVSNLANRYFDNDGDGTFTEVFSHGGEGPVGAGIEFGVADSVITADYDVDGFIDLAVTNGALFYPVSLGGPDTLIRNKGNNNHWIEMDLIGTSSPRDAIGAKIYVTAGGITQLREQSHGYHRWSQNHSRIHFGLANNTSIDQIRIEWPSGAVDTFNNVSADQLYDVTENRGIAPAVLGAPNPVTIEPGEECGEPAYTSTLGPALLVWRECGTNSWRIRAKGGLGRLTENRDLTVAGSLTASNNFGSVSTVSTGSGDIIDNSTRTGIEFSLTVQENKTNTKGFNFNTNNQSNTCLDIITGKNTFEIVYLGAAGKRIELPYDLSDLGTCNLDADGDGIIDSQDPDDDNDGVLDVNDAFPFNPNESADSDGDGVGDNADAFPNDSSETKDTDGDGIGDNSDPTPNGGLNIVSVGNPASNLSSIDGWISNLVINESDTYTNNSNQAVSMILNRFNFYAGNNNAPVTPFIVQVNGNDDFEVLAVGDTRNAFSLGSNSLNFTDATSIRLTIEPGVTIATGFLDANANGTNSDGGSVIRFEFNGDEIWYTGGPNGSDSASVSVGQAPTTGTRLLTNLRRNYAFNIEFELLANNQPPSNGLECGEPDYNRTNEPGVFLWKDCINSTTENQWHLRISGGGLRWSPYIGSLTSSNPVSATAVKLESNDTLDGTPGNNGLDFILNVGNSARDGIDFTVPANSQTCLNITQLPTGAQVVVGRGRLPQSSAFNLENLGLCQ